MNKNNNNNNKINNTGVIMLVIFLLCIERPHEQNNFAYNRTRYCLGSSQVSVCQARQCSWKKMFFACAWVPEAFVTKQSTGHMCWNLYSAGNVLITTRFSSQLVCIIGRFVFRSMSFLSWLNYTVPIFTLQVESVFYVYGHIFMTQKKPTLTDVASTLNEELVFPCCVFQGWAWLSTNWYIVLLLLLGVPLAVYGLRVSYLGIEGVGAIQR